MKYRRVINVLLVENDPADARLLKAMLAEAGMATFKVVHADRLGKALDMLTLDSFDVLLLDPTLPDGHGLDTMVRARNVSCDIPIVVISGVGDESFSVDAVKEGAQDYLLKGHVDSCLLARSICYALERKVADRRAWEAGKELQSIFEALPCGGVVIDGRRRVRRVNEAALLLTGYTSEEEMTGRSCMDIICVSGDGGCPLEHREAGTVRFESRLATRKGRPVQVLRSVCPFELGGEKMLLETFVDISLRTMAKGEPGDGELIPLSGRSIITTGGSDKGDCPRD